MTVQLKITIDTDLVPARTASKIVRNTRRSMMERHHKRFIKKHFQAGAKTRYGYTPRTGQYVRRARRFNPNWRPLMLTGQLRAQMTDPANVRVTATQDRSRMVISNRNHPFMRTGGNPWRRISGTGSGVLPDRIRSEIESVAEAEVRDHARWAEQDIAKQTKDPKNQRRRRRRIR